LADRAHPKDGEGPIREDGRDVDVGAGVGAGAIKSKGTDEHAPRSVIESPVTPFAATDDDWDADLAAWDAAIPIVSRAPVVPPASVASASKSRPSEGAIPDQENPFAETPTTAISRGHAPNLEDLPDIISAGTFDGGLAPASGSYAALVATDQSAPGIFDREPPPDEPATFPTGTLPEFAAAPWTGDIRALISLGDAGKTAAPTPAYFETLERILGDERAWDRATAGDTRRNAALCLGAARVADLLGHTKEALAHVGAALASDGSSPAARRALLVLAERAGHLDDEGATESLARLALSAHPDQPYYRALHAEWILWRASRGIVDGTAAAAITVLPEGLGRTLAEAELAWREPPVAAAILETAAHRVGGGLGAALMLCAAGLNETAKDFQSAAEQRFVAARLDDQGALGSLGVLRDLARLEPDAVVPALEDLLTRFPASPLKVALARWGAAAACRIGNRRRAWHFVADDVQLGPLTAGLARDRLDLWPGPTATEASARTGSSLSLRSLALAVARFWSTPITAVLQALRACEPATAADDPAGAIGAAEAAAAGFSNDDHVSVLAAAVEDLSRTSHDASLRLRALRLWRRIDPARWTSASLDLVDALASPAAAGSTEGTAGTAGAEGTDSADSSESVLREIAARDATSPVFWSLAALSARRGRFADAAAHIDRGLDRPAWRESHLAAPLAELAAELIARADLSAGVARLTDRRTKSAPATAQRRTLERMLRQLHDRDLWAEYVAEEISATPPRDPSEGDRARRAALLLEPVFWRADAADGDDVPSLVSAALDMTPLHPVALGLALTGRPDPAMLVDRFAAGRSGPGGDRWTVAAAVAAAISGDAPRALTLALEARADSRDSFPEAAAGGADIATATRAIIRRVVWAAPDAQIRLRITAEIADSHVRAEMPIEAITFPDDGGDDRLGPLADAARSERWNEVVARLVDAPIEGQAAEAASLALAGMIDEGRCAGARAHELWARARVAERLSQDFDALGSAVESSPWLRASDPPDADPAESGAALEHLAHVAAQVPDQRSAALFLVEAAHLVRGVPDARAESVAEACLRAAIAQDPASAATALAWRRHLVAAGRIDEAADAAAAEAEALSDPALRVHALLRAAAILASPVGLRTGLDLVATPAARITTERVDRAAGFLHRALEIAPHDHDAFTRLRDLYEEAGRHGDLARLLAARLNVTSNPFEVTALLLNRAELFAGPLADRGSAKTELEAILAKEPQHPRALARLADLEQEDGNDAAAADLLIRRAFVERSPDRLRDLFMRLGRIYTARLPDPKRAVSAYARVLQLDANNREALDELSRLYLGLGETKSAIAMTERLVSIEMLPERRSPYHVRLGRLAERASDPRAAAFHFRRAADEAPRDIEALGELVRHLEKTRDIGGRRAVLDRAAFDLRGTVLTDPSDKTAIEALVAVLRWRGRSAAAAAAAELSAFFDRGAGQGANDSQTTQDLPAWAVPPAAGRRLAALSKPSIDEQTFAATVPPSVRHIFRLLGPFLWEGKADPSRYGVVRGDRVSAGRPPRDIFERVGAELAAGAFDLYVTRPRNHSGRATLAVDPGKTPGIFVDGSLTKMGAPAVRFVAGRTLRLVSTHLDGPLASDRVDLGAWLGGVIRQFLPDYVHPDVPPDAMSERAARVAKLMPRKLRNEIMPFAMESSGYLDLGALQTGIRDGANRVGLLAAGGLAAGLRVVLSLAEAGAAATDPLDLSPAALSRSAEAEALLVFALSDEYDDLVKALE
jgi:tetratricopeptide (TPR) repeat protein